VTGVSASFGTPFKEQIAALLLRLANPIPTDKWTDVWHDEHERCVVVTGAKKAELLADLSAAIYKATVVDRNFDKFKAEFLGTAVKHGWHGWAGEGTEKGEAWRARVIYRTNMATSYAAGRMAQLTRADFKFWVYKHGNALEPRLQHLAWDGLALPPYHPFWKTHAPLNGWGCTCYVVGANSEAGIRRLGGDPAKTLPDGWNAHDPKTGAPPGIDKGWDYKVGSSLARTIGPIADKLAKLPAPIGADMAGSWSDRVYAAWSEAFSHWTDETLTGPPRGRMFVAGSLRREWIRSLSEAGHPPATAEIAVRDQDVWHTFHDAKRGALDPAWYRQMPQNLRAPSAVLLDAADPERPTLLLVFPTGDRAQKLVVAVNYRVKKHGVMNVVESGRTMAVDDIGALIGQGAKLLSGKL
jgi:hypothetical protein